jgi:HSP20 family molecular chaperone IbpA
MIKNLKIRKQWNSDYNEFFYSIVDVIDNLELSTDPRNYWKVLKSRLKKEHNQLVTNCNQLKMISSDGKFYLTDTANAKTILQIIELISPNNLSFFSDIFDSIEEEYLTSLNNQPQENSKISTSPLYDGELKVDIFRENNSINILTMMAGILPEDIFISLNCKSLIIKCNRIKNNNSINQSYEYQELFWGKISREIELPFEVDIDRVETIYNHGLLLIKILILDKTRTKILKIK